jgi:ribonuclease HI
MSIQWVRGHSGNAGNEIADKLCGDAARALRDRTL